MTFAEYAMGAAKYPLPIFFRFLQDPATGVLFGPLIFSQVWSSWEGKVYRTSHKISDGQGDEVTRAREIEKLRELRTTEPYVSIAIHIFSLVIVGLLFLIINWGRVVGSSVHSEWEWYYTAALIALTVYFIIGLFRSFFVPDDVIPRYRTALTSPKKGIMKYLPRGDYRMFFSWYRWSFGAFALLTSNLYYLHLASSARP